MKLKSILLTLFAATLCGCANYRSDLVSYYIYGNATEWEITVECFTKVSDETDESAYRKDTSFVIAPGQEFTLMFSKSPLFSPFDFPGSYDDRYLTYSNGEKTFRQEPYTIYKHRNTLFEEKNYETISKSLNACYYKYTFTAADFEDKDSEY